MTNSTFAAAFGLHTPVCWRCRFKRSLGHLFRNRAADIFYLTACAHSKAAK